MKNTIITLLLFIAAHVAAQQVPIHHWTGKVMPDSSINWTITTMYTKDASVTTVSHKGEVSRLNSRYNNNKDSVDLYFSFEALAANYKEEMSILQKHANTNATSVTLYTVVPLVEGFQLTFLYTDVIPATNPVRQLYSDCDSCDYVYLGRYHIGDLVLIPNADANTARKSLANTAQLIGTLYGEERIVTGYAKLEGTIFN